MTPEKYEQILSICQAVESQSDADREQTIKKACAGDEELIKGVHDLLESEAACMDDFEQPILSNINLEQVWREAESFDLESPDDESDQYPAQIGPYQIIGVLGRGGMSIVYKAQQNRPKREIAVKVPLYGLTEVHSYRRFLVEAEALGRLHHPGIAQVYDAGLTSVNGRRVVYIAMEFVQGLSLIDYMQKMKPDIHNCIGILINICEAVSHAHQQGIIHRDLKPSNIIVEVNNNTPTPRILDFGVAKISSTGSFTGGMMTTVGQTMGTLAYMSPEQVIGNTAQIDTRSDVYSIGIIAYELLTEVQPFSDESTSLFHTMHSILQHHLKLPEEVNPQLTGDLSTIIMKAVAKEKSQRYRSAAALRDDLKRFLNHKPIQARPPSPYYLARKFIQRHRLPVVLATLLIGIFITGAVGTTWSMLRYRKTADELAQQQTNLSETATFLTHDLVKNISALAGTNEVRERLLHRLEKMVQSLHRSRPSDPILQKNDAQIKIYLSDVEYDTNRVQQSLQHRMDALTIRKSLLDKNSDDPDLKASISINLVKIGDIYRRNGDLKNMLKLYQQALATDEALVEEYPEVPDYRDNLSWSYERLGHVEMENRRFDQAADYFHKRLQLAEQLARSDPDNLTALYGECSAHNLLYELARQTGQIENMESHAEQAFNIARTLMNKQPDNLLYRIAFARGAAYLASIAINKSQLDVAEIDLYLGWINIVGVLKSDYHDLSVAAVARQILGEQIAIADLNNNIKKRIKFTEELLNLEIRAHGQYPTNHEGLDTIAKAYQRAGASMVRVKKYYKKGIHHLDMAYNLRKQIFKGTEVVPDDYYYYGQIIQYDPRATATDLQQGLDNIDQALSMTDKPKPVYWHLRAQLHARMGNIDEAIKDLQKAINIAPEPLNTAYLKELKNLEDNH